MEDLKIKTSKERYVDVYKEFFDKLYGVDLDYSKEREYKRFVEICEEAQKRYGDDFDVMITFKHRYGDFKLKGIDSYTTPKSMLQLVEKGVELPDDVNSFEIVAKIAVTKHGKRTFLGKKEDVVFSHRVLLTDEVENRKKVEKLVGQKVENMAKNIRVFSREDWNEFSDIVKIKESKEQELSI